MLASAAEPTVRWRNTVDLEAYGKVTSVRVGYDQGLEIRTTTSGSAEPRVGRRDGGSAGVAVGTFPVLDDAARWPEMHRVVMDIWAPALANLRTEWRLAEGEWERLPGGEDSVVFALGGTVVKLVPPFLAADAARDVSVLRRLELPVPSPRVEDVRTIEGWSAVRMTRLDGVCAARAWSGVARTDQIRIMASIGELLRAIWKTPTPDTNSEPLALVAGLRARAERHEIDGFAGIQEFLDGALPNPLPDLALVHLDLTTENLMLRERGGRWELSGVLDFVASRTCFPPLDLVAPGVFFCRGEPTLLRAMLHGAGQDALPADELVAWHLLHPFSQIHRDLALAGRRADGRPDLRLRELWQR